MINKACCSLLFIASIAIIIPTAALQFYGKVAVNDTMLANLSHGIAILLILLCALWRSPPQPPLVHPPPVVWSRGQGRARALSAES